MSSQNDGILTDVATAIGSTLGHLVSRTNQLVETAKRKASGGTVRRAKKTVRSPKARSRAVSKAAKKATQKGVSSAKRGGKLARAKSRSVTKKAHRALR